jgi:hypothetical protein
VLPVDWKHWQNKYLRVCLPLILLSSCAGQNDRLLQQNAASAGFTEYWIETLDFNLLSFEKVTDRDVDLTIYIEGDGRAWSSRNRPSIDPTPDNPIGLGLAVSGIEKNKIYLARPCQYSLKIGKGRGCAEALWTSHRYSKQVLKNYQQALDYLKSKHSAQKLALVGYSGGGAIAALIAADRDDIRSLRTVAGNLDSDFWTQWHDVSTLNGSENPLNKVSYLSDIPQIHYAGLEDKVIPMQVSSRFLTASQPSTCVVIWKVNDVGHEQGWLALWPDLSQKRPICKN